MSDNLEFRVKVTVRNNLLLSAIEDAGYSGHGGITRFCRENDVGQSQLSALLSMRDAPISSEGEFTVTAKAIMEALGAAPCDLWTERQLTMKLSRNTYEESINMAGIAALLESHQERMTLPNPEDMADESLSVAMVRNVLDTLPAQKRKVLSYRYGIGTEALTLEECGKVMGVTRERIRQIENDALRKLRHPEMVDMLAGCGEKQVENRKQERMSAQSREG